MMRSRVHMLTVAAAGLKGYGANPLLVKALKEAADTEAGKLKGGEIRNRDFATEEQRIGRQRTKMAMLGDSRAKDDLLTAMLQRAYDLMWEGQCTECDAIVEFLPSAEVEKMFEAWERDQAGEPKSVFYQGKFSL